MAEMNVSDPPVAAYSDATSSRAASLLERLAACVGASNLLTGDDRMFYATDVYTHRELPMAVARPGSQDELIAVVAAAYEAGVAVVTRGGGASYTGGYLPATSRSVLIDVSRLNRVLEINKNDAYVTVEPGVTWAALDAALAPFDLRTPFRGPFSGLAATVGGSISQNTLGHGSGTWGLSPESVIALEIVTAGGELLKTGQAGSRLGVPFFRYYGPDLTGLFTGDCGAFGVKARITLRLLRRRPYVGAASFSFDSFEDMQSAMAEAASFALDDKAFALDTALQQGQIGKSADASSRFAIARAVIRAAPTTSAGVAQVIRMGLAGSAALSKAPYAAHYLLDGFSRSEIAAKIAVLRRIATRRGHEIPNTVPTVVRAMPFAPLHNVLGPAGERWVPLHGIFPYSAVAAFHKDVNALLTAKQPAMTRLGVHVGRMFSTVGSGNFLYEPALYWKDEQTIYHRTVLDEGYRATLPKYPANPDGAALIAELRNALIDLYHRHGAGHLQVGKSYPLLRDRNPAAVSLLRGIKRELDPKGLMNPGALGL
jgi:FAD/FMN-containing dehydrogenase